MGIGDLLRRGIASGAAAGLAASVWLLLITEGPIKDALAIEDARSARAEDALKAAGEHVHAEDTLVTHPQQIVFATLVLVLVGVLVGVVFSVVYGAARRRLPGYHDHTKSLALAGLAFFAVTLFPFLAIPGNPPAVGDPSTVNERTMIYFGAMTLGLVLVMATFAVDKALTTRVSSAVRTALVLGFVVVVGVGLLLALPNTPDAVQTTEFAQEGDLSLLASPELIWDFRIASLGQFAVLWGTLGAVFGILVSRKAASVEHIAQDEAVSA